MMIWSSLYNKYFQWKVKFYRKVLSSNKLDIYPRSVQPILFLGKGVISMAHDTQIGYFPAPYFYNTYAHIEARNESSRIKIGPQTFLNNNACIISNGACISIGANCRIGCNFLCVDSDFHGKKIEDRDNAQAIRNEEVYLGNNVTILKGCVIGDACIVGADSVVTHSFPAYSIIAGNPAIKIGDLTQ